MSYYGETHLVQALNLFDRFLQNVVRVNFESQHHVTCFEHHGNAKLGVSNLHHFLHQYACSYREGENIKVAINCWHDGAVCVCVCLPLTICRKGMLTLKLSFSLHCHTTRTFVMYSRPKLPCTIYSVKL